MPSTRSAARASACLVEPLAESAPLALRESARLCRGDPATGESCADYHGAWQYLRLLGLVASAARDFEFFRDVIGPLARDGRFRRVLVSGTADYCLPAQLLAIYAEARARLELAVLDICETPLHLSRWYADRTATPIETHAGDVVDYRPDRPFDLICTHSFFGRIVPERRGAAVAAWYRLLRPGGKVVTVLNRVRPDAPPGPVRSSAAETDRLVERALTAAERIEPPLDLDRAAIERLVRRFAAVNVTHPLRSADEVGALFEKTGFVLDRFERGASSAVPQGAGGPSTVFDFAHGTVIASRPV